MNNKEIIKLLEEAAESLNKLDRCITPEGFSHLWSAKQQVIIAKTIMQIEEQINENSYDE